MSIKLYDYQFEAVKQMHNGCILCGGVGSGKSRTGLAYFYLSNKGSDVSLTSNRYIPMQHPKNLYIITTARKRDTLEWDGELGSFLLSTDNETNYYNNLVKVDSWNNISKYIDVKDSFFIFDEQRVIGYGKWTKSFLKITSHNEWILLSATPGDSWQDYMPVFIANGFYKNKTDFVREHVIYSHVSKFPKIDRYLNVGKLIRLRNQILVTMKFDRKTTSHHKDVYVKYDIDAYKQIIKTRWDKWGNKPIKNASGFCQALRRVVNEDISRQLALLEIVEDHPKTIVFYNYNFELDILKKILDNANMNVAEWNGHLHQPIPSSDNWVYLVQYNAGAEGWNCIQTDTIIFYSQNYSYKIMTQAAGRIDRLNSPFSDLYYYHIKSRSGIDLAIERALKNKRNFNEGNFYHQ